MTTEISDHARFTGTLWVPCSCGDGSLIDLDDTAPDEVAALFDDNRLCYNCRSLCERDNANERRHP